MILGVDQYDLMLTPQMPVAAWSCDPASSSPREQSQDTTPVTHPDTPVVTRAQYSARDLSAIVGDSLSWLLKREFASGWEGWPIQTVSRQDVNNVLNAIIDRGSPSAARKSKQARWGDCRHRLTPA